MNVGRLRHKVKLQAPVTSQNPITGNVSTTWNDIADVWAAVESINGKELLADATVMPEVTWRITMRYLEIDPAWRVVNDMTIWGIEAVLPNNRQTQVVLLCKTLE